MLKIKNKLSRENDSYNHFMLDDGGIRTQDIVNRTGLSSDSYT